MMKSKAKFILSVSLILIVMGIFLFNSGETATAQTKKVSFQMNTIQTGSTAYGMMVLVGKLLKDYEPNIEMFVTPCDSLYLTYRLAEKGEGNTFYSGAFNMGYAYARRGPYKDNPMTVDAYHFFYYGSADQFLCTLAERKDINTLADLHGKKVYAGKRGSTWDVIETALEIIGVKPVYKEIDRSAAYDALHSGVIDATLGWTSNFGRSLVPWFVEVETRANLKILQPTDAEWNKMRKSKYAQEGMMFLEFPTTAFTKKLNVDKLRVYSVMPGFFAMPELPEEVGYKIVKLIFENKDELAKSSAAFKLFAEKPAWVQEMGIGGLPIFPVQPGVAKYLKEIGAWKPEWKVGKYVPRKTKTLKIR